MFRCSIAAANTDKLQFEFKFYSYVMWNCVDDIIDNTHYGRQSVGCKYMYIVNVEGEVTTQHESRP